MWEYTKGGSGGDRGKEDPPHSETNYSPPLPVSRWPAGFTGNGTVLGLVSAVGKLGILS